MYGFLRRPSILTNGVTCVHVSPVLSKIWKLYMYMYLIKLCPDPFTLWVESGSQDAESGEIVIKIVIHVHVTL